MESIEHLEFKPYSEEHYSNTHECQKCKGLLKVALMEGCSNSKEASCACGFRKYIFFRDVAIPFDSGVKPSSGKGKRKMKTFICQCHRIFGGPQCKLTWESSAANSLYHPEHSKAAKKKVQMDLRNKKISQKRMRK